MKRDEKMLDLFIKSIGENNILSISGDNPYKIETNKKAFYIYLKKIGSAHLPGKPDVSRIQIPQSTKFDCVIHSDSTFFAIGYDFIERVYIIWNPEKVRRRLNQSKNFSLYSTYAYQHLVRVQQKVYHYTSKQIQDAIIVLPEELEDVLMNYSTYFENKEKSQPQSSTESIDWEGMFTNSAGKLTKLANPALLEKLKECLLQPYPSIPYACSIIADFYESDRFPNMELCDWMGLINSIDWNLPDKILTTHKEDIAEENLSTSDENSNTVNTQTERRRWTNEEMILALDLYFKLSFGQFNSTNPEIKRLAKITGRTPSSIAMRLCNYEYINTGKGLDGGSVRCQPFWNTYSTQRELLQQEAKKILNRITTEISSSDNNIQTDFSTNNTGEVLFVKKIDKSLLQAGTTIPIEIIDKIKALFPAVKVPGSYVQIFILFQGKIYNAALNNVCFSNQNRKTEVIQIRYTKNNPITTALKCICHYSDKLFNIKDKSLTKNQMQYIQVISSKTPNTIEFKLLD